MDPQGVHIWRTPLADWIHIPKCACSYWRTAINERWNGEHERMWSHEWVEADRPLVAFVRDPVKRLESAYRFLNSRERQAPIHLDKASDVKFPPGGLPPFEDFVRYVVEIPDRDRDMHVRSMWRTCCRDYGAAEASQFLPHRLIHFDFNAAHVLLGTSLNRVINPSPPAPTEWTPATRLLYETAYHRDFELWVQGLPPFIP